MTLWSSVMNTATLFLLFIQMEREADVGPLTRPGRVAVCTFCGQKSRTFNVCERCGRAFAPDVKEMPDVSSIGGGASNSTPATTVASAGPVPASASKTNALRNVRISKRARKADEPGQLSYCLARYSGQRRLRTSSRGRNIDGSSVLNVGDEIRYSEVSIAKFFPFPPAILIFRSPFFFSSHHCLPFFLL